ncbi:hypothetical protein HDV01_004402 [Terramyces sp. JEL0728]|nr:hypothetical protein HDV01_004402 [Terramyces sp. JEL0728]
MYRRKNADDGLYPHEVLSQVSFGSLYSHITVSDSELSTVSLAKQKSFHNLSIPVPPEPRRIVAPHDYSQQRRANRVSLSSKSIPNLYSRRERDLLVKPQNARIRKKNSNPKMSAKSHEFLKAKELPTFQPKQITKRETQIPTMNDLSAFNQRKLDILDMQVNALTFRPEQMQTYPTIRHKGMPRPVPNVNQTRKPSLTNDSEAETLGSNSPNTSRKFSFDTQKLAEPAIEESAPTEIDYSSDDTEYDEQLQRLPSFQKLDIPDIYKQSEIRQTWVAEFLSEFDRLRLERKDSNPSFSDTDSIVVLSVEKSLNSALSNEFVYNQSVLVYPPKKAMQSFAQLGKETQKQKVKKPQNTTAPTKTQSQPLPQKKSETSIHYLRHPKNANPNESAEIIAQKVTYSLDKNQIISRSNTVGKTTNKSKFAIDKPLPVPAAKPKKIDSHLSVIVSDGKRVSVIVTPGQDDEKKLNFFKRIMGKKNAKSSPHKIKLLV